MIISIEFRRQCDYGYKQVDVDVVDMMAGFSVFDYLVTLIAFLLVERFNNKCMALYYS